MENATFDRRALRDTLGYFATGVCIAATVDAGGLPVGLTVNSFTSVSLDPPLVLFCIDRGSDSLDGFNAAPGFSVNILSAAQRELSTSFARLKGAERWAGVDWQTGASGSPILVGNAASLDCLKHAVHDGGDHLIFVGRVVSIATAFDSRPLLYHRGAYASLA